MERRKREESFGVDGQQVENAEKSSTSYGGINIQLRFSAAKCYA